ncbi:hypothetical protein [uncultured Robinsoniella sp.]|uniref:glucuronyl esterase domain-containing protein n=1 Tax=uncultured Robinsoniella sp. TaxID=904190 RepID=UPI00374E656D
MGLLESELKKRNLPPLFTSNDKGIVRDVREWTFRREEIKNLLCSEFSGRFPRIAYRTEGRQVLEEEDAYGGKAVVKTISLGIASDYSYASFPYRLALPKNTERPPIFIYLAFTPEIADGIGEEILDAGYGVASVYYQDITADCYDEHQSGLGRFCTRNHFDSWGKAAMWAWGAGRILDDILKREVADASRIAVLGHSRLGKAALLAGAFDERFALTAANESGAGGAALFRGKTGEQIENLYGPGSRLWFNGNFFNYRKDLSRMPFDQHFLLSLIAPRHLYVSSADRDDWADPRSEFLSCVESSKAWKLYGEEGLVSPDCFPKAGACYQEGKIGYHLRSGSHYLSRDDWRQIIAYRDRHGV